MRRIITTLALVLMVATGNNAMSAPIKIAGGWQINDDGKNYWDGFQSLNNYGNQNASEHWGTPDIKDTQIIYSGSQLSTIKMDFNVPETNLWSNVKPGDFFIDLNSDGFWDIVLESKMTTANSVWDVHQVYLNSKLNTNYEYSQLSSHNYSNNSIYKAFTDANSVLPQGQKISLVEDYPTPASTYGIPRYDHPVAVRGALLDNAPLLGTVTFSGWNQSPKAGDTFQIVWDFSTLLKSIDFHQMVDLNGSIYKPSSDHTMTFGFAVSCANDNTYGSAPIPNPEPGTMLLMGAGALGAAFLRRRAKKSAL